MSDLRQSIDLDSTLWEPWDLLAETSRNDAALQLRCYEEAIQRGAGGRTKQGRARLLLWLDKFIEAEREYTRIIDDSPSDPTALSLAIRDRSLARVQLGDYDGAVSDMSTPGLGWARFHIRELLGRFQWINGDFAGAYQTFTAERSNRLEFFRIWSHLCQIGHGIRDSVLPPLWSGEKAPVRIDGVCVSTTEYDLRGCKIGPPQPTVWLWDLLTDLFLDRTTPDRVLAAAQSTLAIAAAWRFPETIEGTPVHKFLRPNTDGWPSQLLFYCGMWHLSKGDMKRARQALGEAAEADMSRSLEKIAAREQLRRLNEAAASGLPARPARPLEKALPPPKPELYRFIEMDLTRPTRSAAERAPVLNLGEHDLGDKGLATLLSSPNLKHITHLDLQGNNITDAGMVAFRSSPFLRNITELNLANNPIGHEGLKHIFKASRLPALRSLDLSNTELTDAGALLLADQVRFQLQRLCLGERALDMPIWMQLADRFGDGLFARGIFRTPYKPPFDPHLVASFSSPVVNDSSFRSAGNLSPIEASVPRCELQFRMVDYVEWLWQGIALERHRGRPARILNRLVEIRSLEKECVEWAKTVYPIDGLHGLKMASEGFDPISLHCPNCAKTYVRPVGRGSLFPERDERRFTCPERHVLWDESSFCHW